ncbi:PfkB family carbohydrate kinase, partial [Ilumatobacter sp.]|uniref:PfkB family carbohydrate kinase n=1 Tax=Ilumatobacter sp. TaxID=1967498 RepID=UPI003C52FC66
MIVVVGEALVDLVVGTDGAVDAVLGGAPFNTARATARLGAHVEFVGGISHDRFGSLLAARLTDDGVGIGHATRTDRPTTLAAAEIGEDGSATYRFYLEQTSAGTVEVGTIPVPSVDTGVGIFFTGGLGFVLEPLATAVVDAIGSLAGDVVVMIDVNCRPAVIEDRSAYVDRVVAVIGRADIVKVSDEDLEYLFPGVGPLAAARRLLDVGARAVVLTAGSSATTVLAGDDRAEIAVPSIRGSVVDTIGAGDTFGAGMLAWWAASGWGRD